MSESKTKCTDCGADILQRTADIHNGRCAPCHRKAAAIPPDGFEVPPDLAERLVALNLDSEDFRQLTWQNGADFIHAFIGKLEERRELYREWSPRLRAFADECRKTQPNPTYDSLSSCDREKQRICEAILNRPMLVADMTMALCCMPLIAIPIAQRLWPRDDDRRVMLTPREESSWNEVYLHPEGAFEWLARFWWNIDDSPECKLSPKNPWDRLLIWWDETDLQAGESPWLVTVGSYYGPLAGAGHQELWSWDGKKTKFVKNIINWRS